MDYPGRAWPPAKWRRPLRSRTCLLKRGKAHERGSAGCGRGGGDAGVAGRRRVWRLESKSTSDRHASPTPGSGPPATASRSKTTATVLSDGAAPTNLTAADVQEMFGDGVCVDAQSRRCDLIPEAQAWLDDDQSGHGRAATASASRCLAELIWQGKVKPARRGTSDRPPRSRQQRGPPAPARLRLDPADPRLGPVQADHRHPQPDPGQAQAGAQAAPVPDLHPHLLEARRQRRSRRHPLRSREQGRRQVQGADLRQQLAGPDPGHHVRHQRRHLELQRRRQPQPTRLASTRATPRPRPSRWRRPSPGLGTQPCPFCAKEPTTTGAKAGDNTRGDLRCWAATPTTPTSSSATTPDTSSAT